LPQGVHATAPGAAAYAPAPHAAQVAAEEAPMAALAVPTPQGVHAVVALEGAYVPAGQALQTCTPTAEKLPAAHGAHASAEVAPIAVEAVPAGHRLHVGSPKPAWKLPGEHGTHVPLGSTKVPAPQLVQTVEPVTLKEPGAQHVPAPVVSANSPPPHVEHATPPVMPENFPRGQAVQLEAAAAPVTKPIGHALQSNTDAGFAEAVYVPGKHVRQAVPPGSDHVFRGQHTVAPGREKVPLGQAVQLSDALLLEKKFSGHGSHV
jgi:hypothetical protein